MSKITKEQVKELLSKVQYPGFTRDIVSFGVIHNIEIEGDRVTVLMKFTTRNEEIKSRIIEDAKTVLAEKLKNKQLIIREMEQSEKVKTEPRSAGDPWAGRAPIPGIKRIIAVASGKGGVGKSTVSTNLAIALSQKGYNIGLMDSDIYGPSVHIMVGVDERPMVTPDQKIIPIEKFGIKMMSMGFLVDSDAPLIWRGPLVMKAVEQFLHDVQWQELDALVIDLPPGTGDAQLTLVQKTPLTGAIIVTTPQEVALVDARRGLKMFQNVNTSVLGIVENMSYFICPHCSEKSFIFGEGGGIRSARQLGIPLLGQIPIEPGVTESGDTGVPIVSKDPESASAKAFLEIAEKIVNTGVFNN
jgi:ATP-binding protein involved in chromosome partitioning